MNLLASLTFPALTTALTLSQREAPDKALVAAPAFPAFTASATLDKRPAILEELTADKTFPAFTAYRYDLQAVDRSAH